MGKRYKLLISVLGLLFSLAAAGIGFGIVGASSLSQPMRFVSNFVFLMQGVSSVWVVIALYRKQ